MIIIRPQISGVAAIARFLSDDYRWQQITAAMISGGVAPAYVTFAATDRILGRVSAGGGAGEEVVFTDAAQALCDDATASDMRDTLGLKIGVNVQAYDAELTSLSALNPGSLINNSLIGWDAGGSPLFITRPAGSIVGTTDGQTLTNKTLTTPVITHTDATSARVFRGSTTATTTEWGDARGILDKPKNGPAGLVDFDLAWWEARFESNAHGDAMATFTDQSPAASNWTQGTAGYKPTFKATGASGAMLPNGLPFVRFDGSDDHMARGSSITANACTIIAVVRNYGGGTGYRCLFCMNNHLLMKSMGTNVWGFYAGLDIGYGSALASGWSIIVGRVTGTGYNNWDMMAAGLMINSTSGGGSAGKTATYFGSNQAAPSQLADVDLAGFAIASSALSSAKVAAAVAYFRALYL